MRWVRCAGEANRLSLYSYACEMVKLRFPAIETHLGSYSGRIVNSEIEFKAYVAHSLSSSAEYDPGTTDPAGCFDFQSAQGIETIT